MSTQHNSKIFAKSLKENGSAIYIISFISLYCKSDTFLLKPSLNAGSETACGSAKKIVNPRDSGVLEPLVGSGEKVCEALFTEIKKLDYPRPRLCQHIAVKK